MSVGYQDNFLVGAPKPVDDKYGPWLSLTGVNGAKDNIPVNYRYRGLTIGFIDGGVLKEYWWKDGVEDSDLVLKLTGGSGVTAGTGLTGTTTISIDQGSTANAVAQLKANISNDITGDAANTGKYPSVKAIKDYTDGLVIGLLNDRGSYNPNTTSAYPTYLNSGSGVGGAILKGDIWYINAAGTISGTPVSIGSSVRALADNPGQTSGNWDIIDAGLGFVPENSANRVKILADFTSNAASQDKYPSINAVKLYIDSVVTPAQGLNSVLNTGSEATNKNLTLTTDNSSTNNLLTVQNTYSSGTKKSILEAGKLSIQNTNTQKATYGHSSISFVNGSDTATLNVTPGGQTLAFPSQNGTLARVEDIPDSNNFVPYTGAMADVDLGNNSLIINTHIISTPYPGFVHKDNGVVGIETQVSFVDGLSSIKISNPDSSGSCSIYGDNYLSFKHSLTSGVSLNAPASPTGNWNIYLPDKEGTVALLSDTSTFVPYTGATSDVNLNTYNFLSKTIGINGTDGSYVFSEINGDDLNYELNLKFKETYNRLSISAYSDGLTNPNYIKVFNPYSRTKLLFPNSGTQDITIPDVATGTIVLGEGTYGRLPKWSSENSVINDSIIYDSGENVGIGTASPSASAKLQVDSTSKGFLPPRMTQTQRLAISSPAEGLIVYQADGGASVRGLYVYDSYTWRRLNWT